MFLAAAMSGYTVIIRASHPYSTVQFVVQDFDVVQRTTIAVRRKTADKCLCSIVRCSAYIEATDVIVLNSHRINSITSNDVLYENANCGLSAVCDPTDTVNRQKSCRLPGQLDNSVALPLS